MKIRGFVFLALIVAATLAATCKVSSAQSVPAPRPTIYFDDQPDYAAVFDSGPFTGLSWLQEVRYVFTPTTGAPTIVAVPWAQLQRGTTAAACPGGAFPCRFTTVTAPFGTYQVTVILQSRDSRVSEASAAIPFSGAGPRPAPPANVRIP